MTAAEKTYNETHPEYLTVVWAVLALRPYLNGHKFAICKDRDALKWIFNMANATGELARWRLHLSKFKFDVVHRSDIKNQAAEVLSQLEKGGTDITELDDDFPELVVSLIER